MWCVWIEVAGVWFVSHAEWTESTARATAIALLSEGRCEDYCVECVS